MALFAVSDVVWQALIAAAVTLILAWMNDRTKTAAVKAAQEAKVAVIAVADTLATTTTKQDAKLEEIHETGEKTHTLVNSAMGEQKRLLATTARAKANITGDPIDVAAAEVAEESYRKHEEKP